MEDNSFKEATKISFKRVKQHISELETALREDREFILEQNEAILHIKSEIKELMNDFKSLKEEISSFHGSTGNDGVINNDQQSSTMINNDQRSSTINNDQQLNNENTSGFGSLEPEFEDLEPFEDPSTMINNDQRSSTIINDHQRSSTIINNDQQSTEVEIKIRQPLSEIKKELEKRFRSLTDREFSVFMAVYHLEERLPDVHYTDVAKMLNISEMTIRGYVNTLISKKIPLEKHRMYNKKVFLMISKEFRELNLASFLLTLRLPHTDFMPQKTLKNY